MLKSLLKESTARSDKGKSIIIPLRIIDIIQKVKKMTLESVKQTITSSHWEKDLAVHKKAQKQKDQAYNEA